MGIDVSRELIMVGSHERTAKLAELMVAGHCPREGEVFNDAIFSTWDGSPNPYFHYDFWRIVLPRGLSDDKEAWDALPDEFTIMRGNETEDYARRGFSWTTQRKTALAFALHTPLFGSYMCPRDEGYVATTRVTKDMVSLYLTQRGEAEIVLHPRSWDDMRITNVEHVTREDLKEITNGKTKA